MDISVGIGRTFMENELGGAGAQASMSSQKRSQRGSFFGRPARMGKTVRGRLTVFFKFKMGGKGDDLPLESMAGNEPNDLI
jgi:hypothetical protein